MHRLTSRRSTSASRIRVLVWALVQARMVCTPVAFGQGSSPQGDISLSLTDAVEHPVKNGLQSVVARERLAQARGEKGISLSTLPTNLSGTAYQANLTANLAAEGLPVNKIGTPAGIRRAVQRV